MEKCTLSGSDFKFMLFGAAVIPTLCFVIGLYVAADIQPSRLFVADQANPVADQPSPTKTKAQEVRANKKRVATNKPFIVQAGVFATKKNANRYVNILAKQDIDSKVMKRVYKGKNSYRVVLEQFASEEKAVKYLDQMQNEYKLKLYVTSLDPKGGNLIASL